MRIIFTLFSAIDFAIYNLVSGLFNLIFDIAGVEIFKSNAIDNIRVKIYVILCVVVIFKVTIACIQYLINPDTFSDKEKGMSGILKKVLVSLALIAVVPVLFDFAREIQQPLSEAIPEVILGTTIEESERDNAGDTLARVTLLTFVRPRLGNATDPLSDGNEWTLKSFTEHVVDGCNFWGADCSYDYQWYFSIPVGIFLVYILLSMGIDIAVRAIKFGVLEILAPVCISSYIMKKDTFTKWYKTCIKVYTDLFIRLAIVYFIIFFVSLLAHGDIEISSGDNYFLTKVFVILGVLFFAKNAPKFICDVLGLDSSGDLKDMFKRTGALASTTGSALTHGAVAYANKSNKLRENLGVNPKTGKQRTKLNAAEKLKALRSGASAGMSALGRGAVDSFNGKKPKEVWDSSKHSAERKYALNEALGDKGISKLQYRKEQIARRLGYVTSGDVDAAKREIDAAKAASDSSKAALDYVHSNMNEKFGNVKLNNSYISSLGTKDRASFDKAMDFTIKDSSGRDVMRMTANDMNTDTGGKYSLADTIQMLTSIVEDQTGIYDPVAKRQASSQLDTLRGEVDKYIVANAENNAVVGGKNPAFIRIIQQALDDDIIHSGDTQFGRDVMQQAKADGIVDSDGNVLPGKVGAWIALNKKMGQDAQTENMKKADKTSATVKEIADKFDKKS